MSEVDIDQGQVDAPPAGAAPASDPGLEGASIDQPLGPSPDAEREAREQIEREHEATDAVEPNIEPVNRVIRGQSPDGVEMDRVYVQKELSFFGKVKVFQIITRAVDRALSDSEGLDIRDVIKTYRDFQEGTRIDVDTDVSEVQAAQAAEFLKIIAKITDFVPDLLEQLFVLVLGVPRKDREWARESLGHPTTGLDDEQTLDIIATAFEQNMDVVRDFYRGERGRMIGRRIQKAISSAQSAGSTQSSTS